MHRRIVKNISKSNKLRIAQRARAGSPQVVDWPRSGVRRVHASRNSLARPPAPSLSLRTSRARSAASPSRLSAREAVQPHARNQNDLEDFGRPDRDPPMGPGLQELTEQAPAISQQRASGQRLQAATRPDLLDTHPTTVPPRPHKTTRAPCYGAPLLVTINLKALQPLRIWLRRSRVSSFSFFIAE